MASWLACKNKVEIGYHPKEAEKQWHYLLRFQSQCHIVLVAAVLLCHIAHLDLNLYAPVRLHALYSTEIANLVG
jgi:hypothetical protein